MGQGEVKNLLRTDKWLCYNDIKHLTDVNRQRLFRTLKQLRRDDDIMIKIRQSKVSKAGFVTYYKLKSNK